MKYLITTICALALSMHAMANDKIPELFSKKEFTSVTLAKAANHYISLGQERSVRDLKALEEDSLVGMKRGFSRNERIGWICRIVFTSKNGKPLRPPRYGGLSLPRLTMPLNSWSLYPVAQSNGVYFVLSEGYMLAGVAERASAYIDYCGKTGGFRKAKLKVPTKDEATKALASFKTAKRWTTIKWKDEGPGTKYTMSSDWVLEYISKQASSIPN